MEQEMKVSPEQTVEVVDIQFRPGQKIYYFDPNGLTFQAGEHVIIDTARGAEYGICAGSNHKIAQKDVVAPLRKVLRKATAQVEIIAADNRAKEKRAYEICLHKISDHGLDMQLVSAEYAFDGSKILFFFTADERVDFRELVKNKIDFAIVSSEVLPGSKTAEDAKEKDSDTDSKKNSDSKDQKKADIKDTDDKSADTDSKKTADSSDENEEEAVMDQLADNFATLGIPMLIDRSADEESDLGKAEWLKVYGAFFGCSDKTDKLYAKAVKAAKSKK